MDTFSDDLFEAPFLSVRPSPIGGRGLFTTRSWRGGDVMMIIAGEIIDRAECGRREIEEGNCYIYFHGADRFIDPPTNSKSRFINHSCKPNSIPETRDERTLYLRALCDIEAGAELTIDYEYDDIYGLCRQVNPLCLVHECPLRPAESVGSFSH